jgi:hypothetical protein
MEATSSRVVAEEGGGVEIGAAVRDAGDGRGEMSLSVIEGSSAGRVQFALPTFTIRGFQAKLGQKWKKIGVRRYTGTGPRHLGVEIGMLSVIISIWAFS